ncbi:MAG TPA: hypothetical protein VGG27_09260 [Magnetospirillaceae bacterium]|jgi:hypothetical protein
MSSTYEINPAQRLVIFHISGVLTPPVMAATREQLKSDPAFDPRFDQINDVRAVSSVAMTADQVRLSAAQSVFDPKTRIAILATRDNPATFGMVRMYELLQTSGDTPDRVGIFNTMEAAIAWLSQPRQPAA